MLLLLLVVFAGRVANAQIEGHVTWAYGAKKTGATEAVVMLKATIDNRWHIYSTKMNTGAATAFKFTTSKQYAMVGKIAEPNPINRYDNSAKMNLLYFEKAVVFQQKIKLKAKAATVKGNLEYVACDDHKCLPPETFEFAIPVAI